MLRRGLQVLEFDHCRAYKLFEAGRQTDRSANLPKALTARQHIAQTEFWLKNRIARERTIEHGEQRTPIRFAHECSFLL